MASIFLKPMVPNLDLIPDLIAVSTFTGNVILISQFGSFWSAIIIICHMDPLHSPPHPAAGRRCSLHDETLAVTSPHRRRCPGLKIILSILLLNIRCPPPHSSYKTFHFVQPLRAHFSLLDRMLPDSGIE